jgi:hypothetical protein
MTDEVMVQIHDVKNRFEKLKREMKYDRIAALIGYAIQKNLYRHDRRLFGYIPGIFPEVEISDPGAIRKSDLRIGEPVMYKVHYAPGKTLYAIPYFYVFCFLKENSRKLDVYFQSAHNDYADFTTGEFVLASEKIRFEGCLASFRDNDISVISVSDPGQFIPGETTSCYAGSSDINFVEVIAGVLESLCTLAGLDNGDTLLFGSSGGSTGALLSSTYFSRKVNVLAVNSLVTLEHRSSMMKACFGMTDKDALIARYGSRISCIARFREKLNSVPNVYILANINDDLHAINREFYNLYLEKYTARGLPNISVFDSYYGVDGHGRPVDAAMRGKIRIAREVLTMKSV